MMVYNGKILKGIGGFYYVETSLGLVECRARGKFRKDDITPVVGDNVKISIEDKTGYLLEILPRKNSFIRPPVSNIDKLLIVSSVSSPSPDPLFIDKMLIIAAANDVDVALCFNKSDLDDSQADLIKTYKKAGYKVFVTSTKNKTGIDDIKDYIKGSVMAVCGFSGVGKSSILNNLADLSSLEVGEISLRLNRGKHTTRHVELIKTDSDTYIADTPGFSSLAIPRSITVDNLIQYFPDLMPYTDDCKFSDCSHTGGAHCGVYNALQRGEISPVRYEDYKHIYDTIKDIKEWEK